MQHKLVTVEISTKDRYELLAHTIHAIINQSYKPYELLIYDDGQCLDLREHHLYKNLFLMLERKGIKWCWKPGHKRGQVRNHIQALIDSKGEFVWRVDDDNIPEPDCLEKLMPLFDDPKVGAVASCVLHPDTQFAEEATSPSIKDVMLHYAIQFHKFSGVRSCEHLYSTFVVRKSVASNCYPSNLSSVGHREETTMSYELFRKGCKLLVNGDAVTWHLRAGFGGIRTFCDGSLWAADEEKFQARLKAWNVELNKYFLAFLDCGIGDSFVFKSLMPEIKAKHSNSIFLFACAHPQVFFDMPEIKTVSIETGKQIFKINPDNYNVYKFGFDNKWQKPIKDIFKHIYGL